MTVRFAAVAAGIVMAVSSVAQAQDAASAKLDVELNALAPSQKGCMMTFVAENDLQAPINKISFELAFFNDKNAVDRITVLDFRDLPQGKKRVRQFDMPNVKCESVTRILINDTPVCDGPAAGECMKGLVTRSQISVPFEG
ncbi:hypothetical protein RLEG12_26340 [Rhizobium leguminosarum bv. trifolii CB782]|uniref:Tat pathway signal protein n=1 Tax=Rhizobium hidalgonense TaxID=1538159 RepID=A0AAJ2GUT6_9HYPH|nr:hypothetical protein [Rhizobium hidalgonense]AHG46537.1 hypothetical protein RLEG12_26340 [Rhizobium leguminosarum bv. trifolii CB782]EJC77467.1 hypothetical protein Rleg10DRAFT_6174 [Rhizobium leguminosarum bv. trifolii WSM2012]MDR9773574.1 hypothetical protein [Rhizobium hidalgonense]MDR9807311.1 hypothetical protein [Rhizobium hidalgonense]MDR9811121.1 hypothetical protein [Rhizobium hidalgonense]